MPSRKCRVVDLTIFINFIVAGYQELPSHFGDEGITRLDSNDKFKNESD